MIEEALFVGVLCMAANEGGHRLALLLPGWRAKLRAFHRRRTIWFAWAGLWRRWPYWGRWLGVASPMGLALLCLFAAPDAWTDGQSHLCYWTLPALHFWTCYPAEGLGPVGCAR